MPAFRDFVWGFFIARVGFFIARVGFFIARVGFLIARVISVTSKLDHYNFIIKCLGPILAGPGTQ